MDSHKIPEPLDDYDWGEAFSYAGGETSWGYGYPNLRGALPGRSYDLTPFSRSDVAYIGAMEEGENDGDSWIIYGRLTDGRWFFLEAGCDYTGWDCQADGSATIANSREEIEWFGMGESARRRLGVEL